MAREATGPESGVVIVDGYNLIRSGLGITGGSLEEQRTRLEVQIREFLNGWPDVHVVLIYDGNTAVTPGAARRGAQISHPRLEVLYSQPPEQADDLVLRECRRRRTHHRVTVVTSDRKDIVAHLPRRNVSHVSSEEFAFWLDEAFQRGGRRRPAVEPRGAGSDESPPGERPAELAPGDVDHWVEAFSETPDEPGTKRGNGPAADQGGDQGEDTADPEEGEKPAGPRADEIDRWVDIFSRPENDP